MSQRRYREKEFLEREYINKAKSIKQLADQCNASTSTIYTWLQKHNIRTRSRNTLDKGEENEVNDEEYLRRQYWEEEKTIEEIASGVNVATATVIDRMNEFGIERRSRREALANGDLSKLSNRDFLEDEYHNKGKSLSEIAEDLDLSITSVYRAMDSHGISRRDISSANTNGNIEKLENEEWLRNQYRQEKNSLAEIAEDIDLNDETVRRYCLEYGIELRDRTSAIPKGEEHYNWSGGYSTTYGPNWKYQRRNARMRDQARCQRCGLTEPEQLRKYGCLHPVHHIIPRDKFTTEDGTLEYEKANALDNLITLCSKCHPKLEGLPIDTR